MRPEIASSIRSVDRLPGDVSVVTDPPSKWRMAAPYIITASVGAWTVLGSRIYCANALAVWIVFAFTILGLFYSKETQNDLTWRFVFAWWVSVPFACFLCLIAGCPVPAPTAAPTACSTSPTAMPSTAAPANVTS